jgi:hypothetical protein
VMMNIPSKGESSYGFTTLADACAMTLLVNTTRLGSMWEEGGLGFAELDIGATECFAEGDVQVSRLARCSSVYSQLILQCCESECSVVE